MSAQKRFYTTLLVEDAAGNSVWAGGFFERAEKPGKAELLAMYRADARAAFQRKGLSESAPVDLHVANLFELPGPPSPPPGQPLRNWKVRLDFVCHDVKFGASREGIFAWPELPGGAALDRMAHVLCADALAMRGDGPDNADYGEFLRIDVSETTDPPTHPPAA